MSFLSMILRKVKSMFSKKTTGAIIAIIVSFVYFTKVSGKQPPNVALSYFLLALNQNTVKEVLTISEKI